VKIIGCAEPKTILCYVQHNVSLANGYKRSSVEGAISRIITSLCMVCRGILEWNVAVHSCFHDSMAARQHFAGIMEDRENTHSTSCTVLLILHGDVITPLCWVAELEFFLR